MLLDLDEYVPGDPERPHLLHRLQCTAKLTEFLLVRRSPVQENNVCCIFWWLKFHYYWSDSPLLQEPLPTMETFLQILLECWNGEDYQDQIFKLLSFTTLQPFERLASHYLHPLQRLYVGKGVKFKCGAVGCLTDLLRFWGAVEWPRYCRRKEASLEGNGEHLRYGGGKVQT